MRSILIIGLAALLGACSTQAPMPAPPTLLSAAGIGPIRFGMRLDKAEQVLGSKATLPQPFDPACSMVRFPALPNLRFMVEDGIVTRADAGHGVGNVLGLAVGATLAQVRTRHPEARITPHKYDENGNYATFPSPDGRSALILELADGKVSRIRAGLQPSVAYVETCS